MRLLNIIINTDIVIVKSVTDVKNVRRSSTKVGKLFIVKIAGEFAIYAINQVRILRLTSILVKRNNLL